MNPSTGLFSFRAFHLWSRAKDPEVKHELDLLKKVASPIKKEVNPNLAEEGTEYNKQDKKRPCHELDSNQRFPVRISTFLNGKESKKKRKEMNDVRRC